VRSVVPYAVVSIGALVVLRRELDVLAVGDDEAASLGMHVTRTRLLVVLAASLATAAAVSVSGLIGFIGLVVPHLVRLLAGSSFRVVVPLSMVFGAAFLALADLVARTAMAPQEIPIGVVTAFFGAPFFVLVLRARRRLV
jgi:iron complex transport system permease protein